MKSSTAVLRGTVGLVHAPSLSVRYDALDLYPLHPRRQELFFLDPRLAPRSPLLLQQRSLQTWHYHLPRLLNILLLKLDLLSQT